VIAFVIVALALCEGGYMLADGLHAVVTGSYITPGGRGELGPWTLVVSAIGIDPGSGAMHLIFVAFGITYFACVAAYLARVPYGRNALAAVAVATLWYLPIGTFFSILQPMGLWFEHRYARSHFPNRR